MQQIKKLTTIRHDTGNCRLYVKDDDGRRYVIIDQGHTVAKWGEPQFQLHTHSKDGEPDTPLHQISWVLADTGKAEAPFIAGMSYDANVSEQYRTDDGPSY